MYLYLLMCIFIHIYLTTPYVELPGDQAFLVIQDHLLHHTLGYIPLQGSPGQLDKKKH